MNNQRKKIHFIQSQDLKHLPQLAKLSPTIREEMHAVARILPFRANNYIIEELIDWNNIPDDPIFRLTFPHPDMIHERDLNRIIDLLRENSSTTVILEAVNDIRLGLNPNPDGQKYNVPVYNNELIQGAQQKYKQTVLIFPTHGQYCHAYCTFCFRWPQFVGSNDFKFATRESGLYQDYIREHHEITDVLITGGDPMVMKAKKLALYIEPFLTPEFDHIQTIRIGTKSVAYWPYRFVTDEDADELLRLFEKVVQKGKHLTVMGHYSHWRELDTPIAQLAIQRIRATGAQLRTQSPVIRYVNDDASTWSKMWQMQVRLGCSPYYMFVERQTGAKEYFEMPLIQAFDIYRQAFMNISGIARTARGPVMSALPGKVHIEGVSEIHGEKVFVLSFLQARNIEWCKRPFFAAFDPKATWLDDLKPAFGETKFFYESELEEILGSERDL